LLEVPDSHTRPSLRGTFDATESQRTEADRPRIGADRVETEELVASELVEEVLDDSPPLGAVGMAQRDAGDEIATVGIHHRQRMAAHTADGEMTREVHAPECGRRIRSCMPSEQPSSV
jgi:hypothetical protein